MANWGFLGAGSIAESSLGPAVRAARGAHLHAVASRSAQRAWTLTPEKVYTDYPDLLADPAVDIVYIALHNAAHREWAEAALAAGKHVLCEKPLGLSATGVDSMIRSARAADRLLVEAAWNRWHPRTQEMESLVGSGAIGQTVHVTSRFHGLAPAAGNYRLDSALGGGALYDVGYYAISATLAAFGWQTPRVERVRHQRWTPTSADSSLSMTLAFPCGGTADIECSLTGTLAEEFTVRGTDGAISLSSPAFTAGVQPSRLDITKEGCTTDIKHYPAVDPYRLMVENIERSLAGEAAYVMPLEQTRLIAQVIDAARTVIGFPPGR